jgi:DNA repair protein RecN (Recombination protein N)
MLTELALENLGVIDKASVTFGPGFTVVTGETGAGKTMLVEAIALVVGGRAEAHMVRPGAAEARVEARFVTVAADGTETETVLCRVVAKEGRSRAYVDGRMATVGQLAEIGADLVDMHGQHSHQRLLGIAAQRSALDRHAGIALDALRAARERVTQIDASLAALGGDERSRAREIDLLRFQVAEIDDAAVAGPDEDLVLEREEDMLAGAAVFREVLWAATELLGGDGGAADAVARAARLLAPHQGLSELSLRLAALSAEASDVASELRHAAESAEENPERLAQVRERRNLLRDLCRKYGDSLGEVIAYGRTAAARLAEMEGYEERVSALSAERASALADLAREQMLVGDARRAAATGLAAAVAEVLRGLALPHASLVVSVGDRESDPAGEAVTFLFSANPGSDPLPLAKVASGGELARTMLALRLVLSDEQGTMVFDEVDAGIGGSAAVAVASALSELGSRHQVLAVTHLPQVAASAHTQVSVEKKIRAGSTVATVRVLGADERVGEIARMLSGGVADDSATAHARDLMEQLSRRGKSPGRPKGKSRR